MCDLLFVFCPYSFAFFPFLSLYISFSFIPTNLPCSIG